MYSITVRVRANPNRNTVRMSSTEKSERSAQSSIIQLLEIILCRIYFSDFFYLSTWSLDSNRLTNCRFQSLDSQGTFSERELSKRRNWRTERQPTTTSSRELQSLPGMVVDRFAQNKTKTYLGTVYMIYGIFIFPYQTPRETSPQENDNESHSPPLSSLMSDRRPLRACPLL